MIPLLADTTLITNQLPLPTQTLATLANSSSAAVTPVATLAGTPVNIGGIPALIPLSSMHINPVFDWTPIVLANGTIGLPIWLFVTAGFLLLFIVVILSWVFKLKRMSAVKGYVEAAGLATQEDMQVWIFGKTKKLTIECLKYWGGMIHYPAGVKITKWRHASIMSTLNIGGVTAVAVSDDYDQTRDLTSEIALTYGCEMFNRDQLAMKEWSKANKVDVNLVKPIMSFGDYAEYGRRILEMRYPDGLEIPAFSIFDHTKFRKYFPKGRDGDLSGGIFIRKARKLRVLMRDASLLEKVLPLAICVIFVGIVIFAAMFVPLGK